MRKCTENIAQSCSGNCIPTCRIILHGKRGTSKCDNFIAIRFIYFLLRIPSVLGVLTATYYADIVELWYPQLGQVVKLKAVGKGRRWTQLRLGSTWLFRTGLQTRLKPSEQEYFKVSITLVKGSRYVHGLLVRWVRLSNSNPEVAGSNPRVRK